MKKLSNFQINKKDDLIRRLTEAELNLSHAINVYNIEIEAIRGEIVHRTNVYNQAVLELNEFIEEIHREMEDYYNERSDKWREDSQGEDYLNWMAGYEATIDEYELLEPDYLEDLDPFDSSELTNTPF